MINSALQGRHALQTHTRDGRTHQGAQGRSMRRLLTTTSLLLASPLALAQGDWTISGHLGVVDVDHEISADPPWWTAVNDSEPAYGISATYKFLPQLGVRLMYEQARGLKSHNVCPPGGACAAIFIREDANLRVWSLAAMPRIPLTEAFSIYGTVGLSRWNLSVSGDQLPGDSGSDLTLGAGASWNPYPRVEVGLEYQFIDFNYNGARLNLGYRF